MFCDAICNVTIRMFSLSALQLAEFWQPQGTVSYTEIFTNWEGVFATGKLRNLLSLPFLVDA